MRRLTTNQKLAVVGITLAVVSLVTGLLFPNGMNGANQPPRFISVMDLAWQIKERKPIELIDIRSPELYNEFHLPTAKNVPLQNFEVQDIDESDLFIFYSGDDLLVRQLWISLPESVRSKSYLVYGGVRDWFDHILYPSLPLQVHDRDSMMVEQIDELCRFYGGQVEFNGSIKSLDYYYQDVNSSPWPVVQRAGKLVRRGC